MAATHIKMGVLKVGRVEWDGKSSGQPCEERRKRDSRRLPQSGGWQETARILFGSHQVQDTLVPHKET